MFIYLTFVHNEFSITQVLSILSDKQSMKLISKKRNKNLEELQKYKQTLFLCPSQK